MPAMSDYELGTWALLWTLDFDWSVHKKVSCYCSFLSGFRNVIRVWAQ